MKNEKTRILDEKQINQKIKRLAFEIYENTFVFDRLMLGGIDGNGYHLAERIATILKDISDQGIYLFRVNIDKQNPRGNVSTDQDEKSFANQSVILIDDVINSGKTMMFAAGLLIQKDIKMLNTAVLVDRKHRSYPIKTDYVGLSLSTTLQDHIQVSFGDESGVYLT